MKTLRQGILIGGAALVVVSSALACSSSSPSENEAREKDEETGGAGTTPDEGSGGGGTTPDEGNGGATTPTGSEGGATGELLPPSLTCVEIWQCIVDCPAAADPACSETCIENGTAEGQSALLELAQCIDAEQCTDEICLQDYCQPSLAACVSAPPEEVREPAPAELPPGDVPPDFVGSWANVNSGTTIRLVLGADGTGSYMVGSVSNITGCFSTRTATDSGNAVVTSDKIIIYSDRSVVKEVICSVPSPQETGTPTTIEIAYTAQDADTLKTIDETCAARYAGSDYSIRAYCTVRLTRE